MTMTYEEIIDAITSGIQTVEMVAAAFAIGESRMATDIALGCSWRGPTGKELEFTEELELIGDHVCGYGVAGWATGEFKARQLVGTKLYLVAAAPSGSGYTIGVLAEIPNARPNPDKGGHKARCDNSEAQLGYRLVDSRGKRVAFIKTPGESHGRYSPRWGWVDGVEGEPTYSFVAEDGVDVTGQRYARADDGIEYAMASTSPAPCYPEGSRWFPEGAVDTEQFARGTRRSEWEVTLDWEAAQREHAKMREERKARNEQEKLEAQRLASSPFAALAALKRG
jgi:hypothetical protein